MCSPYVWNTSGLNPRAFGVLLFCITNFTVFVDSDLLPFLCIHHRVINFMPQLLEIKIETSSGDAMIKHFSLVWWIHVMGPTVLVGCLQPAVRILYKYNLG
jgi:hypothetical protein